MLYKLRTMHKPYTEAEDAIIRANPTLNHIQMALVLAKHGFFRTRKSVGDHRLRAMGSVPPRPKRENGRQNPARVLKGLEPFNMEPPEVIHARYVAQDEAFIAAMKREREFTGTNRAPCTDNPRQMHGTSVVPARGSIWD